MRSLSPATPTTVRDTIWYDLLDALERACMKPTSDGGFNLPQFLLEASPVGWAINLMRREMPRALNRAIEEQSHFTDIPDEVLEQIMQAPAIDPSEQIVDDESLDRRAAEAEESLRRMRGEDRIRQGAAHAHVMFNIPDLQPPARQSRKDHLLALAKEHPGHIMRSLEGRASGEPPTSPFCGLWKNFNRHEAADLLSLAPDLILVIVHSALLPRRRPNRNTVAQVKRLVKQASGRRGWPSVAGRLVDAWLQEFFERQSQWDTRSNGKPQSSAQCWEVCVAEARSFPNGPFGEAWNGRDIDRWLCRALTTVTEINLQV